eukprot:COSAG01_NODE_42245_length_442_cov_0.565598_1_plen_83_part_01
MGKIRALAASEASDFFLVCPWVSGFLPEQKLSVVLTSVRISCQTDPDYPSSCCMASASFQSQAAFDAASGCAAGPILRRKRVA